MRKTIFLSFILILLALTPLSARAQTNGWQIGQMVRLQKGVCIREGPGFSYRAHTKVPVDDWEVVVIDGPRQADGRTWYDTSRKKAGDPSGGTGWVAYDQSDRNCPEAEPKSRLPQVTLPAPQKSRFRLGGYSLIQWVWIILILAAVVWLWRLISPSLWLLLYFGISGLALWFVMDLVRPWWQNAWWRLAGPNAPDLAILVALLPVASWLVNKVSRR